MADPCSYSRPATGYPAPPSHHLNGYPSATSSASAYPPPPPPTNLYYYNQTPPYPNPRATLLRRLIAAFIAVTVLFFTIFFICWLVIRPHRPQFHITSLSLSNLNLSSHTLTANWNARFDVYNPNKKLKISYDQLLCSLFFRSEILSRTRLPPFYQDTKNLTSLPASFSALDTYLDDRLLKDFSADTSRGAVSFNLRIVADVGFKVGGFRARRRVLKVSCDNVPVALTSSARSGNLTGGARDCDVYA